MREWITGLVATRYKTEGAVARAIGMTESGFSRAVKAGTFDVENCLKLAHATREPAPKVFELAGKSDVDLLIQHLYGPPPKTAQSREAANLAVLYDQIQDRGLQDALTLLAEKYVELEKLTASHRTSAKRR